MEGGSPRALKHNERIRDGVTGPLTTSTSPRSSTRSISTAVHNGNGKRIEPVSLVDTKRSSQHIEKPMLVLQAELNLTLSETCNLADKLAESTTECKQLQAQNAEVRRKLGETQRDLNDAQDFILGLQRTEQTLTESEATKDYVSLCMSVEDWVQTRLGEAIEKRLIRNEATISGPFTRKLLSYIPEPGKEAFQFPETDEYNLTAAVMSFLFIEVFNRDFYCPIDQGAMELLSSIERSMRNSRDLTAWRSWRSETFTAITKRHEFVKQRQLHSNNLSKDLTSMLGLFLPRSDHRKLLLSIQSTIVEPALQLAHKMHLSVNEFSLVYTQLHRMEREKRRPMPSDSSPFDCVTVSPPWKSLKFPVTDANLIYLFDLSPGLVSRAVKTTSFAESRVLKRARVLVTLSKDGDGSYKAASQTLREPVTLLGWMHDCVYSHQTTLKGKLFKK